MTSVFRHQFSLRTLLGAVGVLAVICVVAKYAGVGAAVLWLLFIGVTLSGAGGHSAITPAFWACFSILQSVFLVGVVCCATAYYTLGFVASMGMWMLMSMHFIPAFLCAARRYRSAIVFSLLILLVAGFTVIPEQAELTYRLHCCKREARQMIRYLEMAKMESAVYPSELAAYKFQYPNAAQYMYYTRQPDGYSIYFSISSGASYWYTPSGGWGFYDD